MLFERWKKISGRGRTFDLGRDILARLLPPGPLFAAGHFLGAERRSNIYERANVGHKIIQFGRLNGSHRGAG